ncbi:hypothetical protein M885DRAFT_517967 [Pelagophyceae sp. CCMP2097]|nr:hypothetical protein M885DRAFT_517967 [Pelagophyceae sp. CCMP2097]
MVSSGTWWFWKTARFRVGFGRHFSGRFLSANTFPGPAKSLGLAPCGGPHLESDNPKVSTASRLPQRTRRNRPLANVPCKSLAEFRARIEDPFQRETRPESSDGPRTDLCTRGDRRSSMRPKVSDGPVSRAPCLDGRLDRSPRDPSPRDPAAPALCRRGQEGGLF